MPQVLKEGIRENIREAALYEFHKNGYRSTTIKNIASRAEIPSGLIYSYFKNKDDLFEKILQPVIALLKDTISNNLTENPERNLYEKEIPIMLRCIHHYNQEMVILIDKSEGSKLTGMKDEIIREVTEHIKIIPVFKNANFDNIFYHILATNFMEGLFEIARHYSGKQWSEKMMDLLIKQHLYGIYYFKN